MSYVQVGLLVAILINSKAVDFIVTVAIPFAKGFGWGGELTLEYIFEKLFKEEFGGGYPKERAVPEQRNKKILDEVKKITYNDIPTILKEIDQEFLYETINTNQFKENFFKYAEDGEIKDIIKKVLKIA